MHEKWIARHRVSHAQYVDFHSNCLFTRLYLEELSLEEFLEDVFVSQCILLVSSSLVNTSTSEKADIKHNPSRRVASQSYLPGACVTAILSHH